MIPCSGQRRSLSKNMACPRRPDPEAGAQKPRRPRDRKRHCGTCHRAAGFRAGRACAKALALFQDELVKLIYDLSTFHIYCALKPAAAEPMALAATGGYGRGLMAPSLSAILSVLRRGAWSATELEAPPDDLAALAAGIRSRHEAFQAAIKSGLEHAIACG